MAISLTRRPGVLPSLLATVLAGISMTGCSGGSSDGSSTVTPPAATVPQPPGGSDPAPNPPTPGAATDTVVRLQWHPSTESISGYIVYYGSTPEEAIRLAVQLSQGEFPDAQAPSVSFNAGRDLGLNHGERVCFRLRAYGAGDAVSDLSDAECSTI